MKFRAKKILAALLCLCMVAAVIPAGAPQAAAADGDVVVTFSDFWTHNVGVGAATGTYDISQNPFEYNGKKVYSNNATNYVAYPAYANLVLKNGGWFALPFTVSEAGVYSTSMTEYANGNDGAWSAYIVRADELTAGEEVDDIEEKIKSNDYKVMSATADQAQVSGTIKGSTIPLSQGEYKLVIQSDGGGTLYKDTYYLNNLVSFTLTKYSETYTFGKQNINSNTCDISTDLEPNILFYNNGESKPLLYFTYETYNYAEMSVAKNLGGWYAFEITVDYDGEYTPVITTAAEHLTDDYKVYLVPASVVGTENQVANINTAISGDTYWLGDVTGHNDKTTNPNNSRIETPTTLSAKSLAKGTYRLVLVAKTARTYGTKIGTTDIEFSRMKVTSFTLTCTGEYKVDPIEMKFGTSPSGWTLNAASGAKFENAYADGQNMKIPTGEALAVDFEVEVAGDYELTIASHENPDYGLNAEILIDTASMGYLHNDSNEVGGPGESVGTMITKGFGKISLEAKTYTLKIVGLEPDTIDAWNRTAGSTDRAGSIQLYLGSITLTLVDGEVVKNVKLELGTNALTPGGTTTATAKAYDSNGDVITNADITIKEACEPSGVVSYANGVITANKAGRAVIDAEYTVNGVVYEDRAEIVVTNDAIFGNVYAYIEEDTDNIVFLGGLKSIEGYTEVGFYVYVGSDGYDVDVETPYTTKTTTSVYKKIVAADEPYDTDYFNVGDEGYIFCVDGIAIDAGKTVIVRPFVKDASGTDVIYGQQYTMTVSQ